MDTAVILFAYNRPHYLKRALKTHKKVAGLKYYAFIDYSNKNIEVMNLITHSGIYDEIILRREHYGLNRNITEGITEVFEKHDAVIVLEDDLLIKEGGLEWLSGTLWDYRNENYVGSISLYHNKEQEFQSWGWATYRKIWDKHKHIEGGRTQAQQFKDFQRYNNLICITPNKSKVKHIGWKGEHFRWLDFFSIRRLWRKYVL